jgi:anion-transporting  ArsA/GET3 family ATPase
MGATPVVMAVFSTLLAGLASSEMTKAQYDRSLAAQEQSKAGDQWSFFQSKKLRAALHRNTLDVIAATSHTEELDVAALRRAVEALPSSGVATDAVKIRGQLLEWLAAKESAAALALWQGGEVNADVPEPVDPPLRAALAALERQAAEETVLRLSEAVDRELLDRELAESRGRTQAFDTMFKPRLQGVDRAEAGLSRLRTLLAGTPSAGAIEALHRGFTVQRLRLVARRYDAEARLNQVVAGLLELQVRQSNLSAGRHQKRSGRFFYAMLAAQTAVIAATFSLASAWRKILWVASLALGTGGLVFGLYVFFGA